MAVASAVREVVSNEQGEEESFDLLAVTWVAGLHEPDEL